MTINLITTENLKESKKVVALSKMVVFRVLLQCLEQLEIGSIKNQVY